MSIAIRGLKVRYGQHTVLHEIDLDASAGRVLGIVGPNGSGKSTLVKAVAGLGKIFIQPLKSTCRHPADQRFR